MVLWFMTRNYLNDPTLFLHFCNYPPLKRTWTFIWINLNSHHALCLYQVWLKLACCFWRRFFFNTNISEYGFPNYGPSRHPGTMISRNLNLHYRISESFYVNITYSGSVVLMRKIFKWPHPIFAFLWLSPLWRGPGPFCTHCW